MEGRGLISLKVAALLHDPPWKPWVICGRRAYITGKDCDRSRHECEAVEFGKHVWPETYGEVPAPWDGRVKTADRFAASMERLALNKLYEEGTHPEVVCGNRYVNIFDPKFSVPVRTSVGNEVVAAYVDELSRLMRKLADKGVDSALSYNVLYTLLEPLWYRHCREASGRYCVPVADTRFPNHTVFDHVQASATVMNWVHKGGMKGFLVKLDLAGIQEFLAKSRKLLDLWAGSWLVSAMAWYLVADIVRWVGPDTVISPALSFNPFYLSSLLRWLRGEDGLREVADKVEEVTRDLGYAGRPEQPMMPGTVILALPCLNEEEVGHIGDEKLRKVLTSCDPDSWRKYFVERYRDGWRKVYSAIREEIIDEVRRFNPENGGRDAALKLLEKAGEEPPLLLRTVIVDVGKAREEYGPGSEPDPLFFHWLITEKLPRTQTEEGWGSLRFVYPPGTAEEVLEYTRINPNSGRCTICGVEPAVLTVPKEGYEGTGTIYKEGEKLGPYCLIKRKVSTSPDKVAQALGMEWLGGSVYIPSNVEVANVNAMAHYLLELKKALDDARVDCSELVKEGKPRMPEPLRLYLERIVGVSEDELKILDGLYTASLCWGRAPPVYDAIVSGDAESVKEFVDCLSHSLSHGDEDVKRRVEEVVERVVKSARDIARKYYAVVKADGDNFGKVLRGRLGMEPATYVQGVLSSAELARSIGGDAMEKLIKYYTEAVSRAQKAGESVCVKRSPCGDGAEVHQTVIVTPTYLRAVSRAMMITAIADQRVIRENFGVVIYAGGDDLAALVPAWVDVTGAGDTGDRSFVTPADVVAETRRLFWGVGGGEFSEGFILVGYGVYPAARTFGRTYGVVITHVMDPFSYVWSLATELEEMKEGVGTVAGEFCWPKDITAVFYGRVGSVDPDTAKRTAAVITNMTVPGMKPANALLIITRLLSGIVNSSKSGKPGKRPRFSKSLLYDTTSDDAMKTINLLGTGGKDLVMKYIKYIMKRNIERGAEGFVESIIKEMESSGVLDARLMLCSGASGACGDKGPGQCCECKSVEAVTQVFLASRYFYSGRR